MRTGTEALRRRTGISAIFAGACGGWLNETDQSRQRTDGLHQSKVFDGFTRCSTVAKLDLNPFGRCGTEFVYNKL